MSHDLFPTHRADERRLTELDVMPAQCVVLKEFLAPQELQALMRFAIDQESAFQLSEVISPGVAGSSVDFDQRRSRVLMELGSYQSIIANRINSCWPQILQRLARNPFRVSRVEAQITASNDGDYFRWHTDNGQSELSNREITFVYFFHREPKRFRGGELRIYDSQWEDGACVPTENYRGIVPQQNQLVLFPSSLPHEITAVDCPSRVFADGRFTVNGWLHR